MQLEKIEYCGTFGFGNMGNKIEAAAPCILPAENGTQTMTGEMIPACLVDPDEYEWARGEMNDFTETFQKNWSISEPIWTRIWIAGITEIMKKFTA